MATANPLPISLSEYLRTSYKPDRDFVDGLVEERKVGGSAHFDTVEQLILHLLNSRKDWGVIVLPSLRIQVSESRIRVADLSMIAVDAPRERVVQTPPVAVIEVFAPEDVSPRFAERLEDYRRMGVRNIWVVDPVTRKGFDGSSGEWVETTVFDAGPIHLDLAATFAVTDASLAR